MEAPTDSPTWSGIEGRRVIREYETTQAMLDDVWEAHQHGWLPVSKTELQRQEDGGFLLWKRSHTVYVVTYYYRH